jgi:flagellar biogenesis protein FliO
MKPVEVGVARTAGFVPGGIAGWLLARLRKDSQHQQRLELVERIALAPRQSLALVEADGRRFLVATSQDGAPAFYPLDVNVANVKRFSKVEADARLPW